MLTDGRADLLSFLHSYARARRRRVRRLERWRRRGCSQAAIAVTADRIATSLAERKLGPGDRVGLYLKDGPLWIAAYFGVLRSGAVAVPLDPSYRRLAGRLTEKLELRAWLIDREVDSLDLQVPMLELDWDQLGTGDAGVLPAWPDPDPDRLAQIALTSGTSDLPQAVEIRHRNLRAVLDALGSEIARYRWAIRLTPPMRIAVSLPLSHLYGQLMGIYLPVLLAADVALVETMAAEELATALRLERAWVLATVPHTLDSLANYLLLLGRQRWGHQAMQERLARAQELPWHRRWALFDPLRRQLGRRLIAVVSGGATLEPPVEGLWRGMGYLVIQGYGLTEATPLVTLNHPLRSQAGTIGRPLPGVEVRLAADGEILVQGENVARPVPGGATVDEGGWLHTGDVGRRDADGRIRFIGRKRDRLVTPAGINVETGEVAAELRRQPGILDAVVMERPWGKPGIVCAVLRVYPGVDPAAAVQKANDKLADAARVRSWYVWPGIDLPRTPTGKPRRRQLLEWLRRQAQGSGGDGTEPAEATESPAGQPVAAASETVITWIKEIAATDLERLAPETPLAEALTSLERVELAAKLERDYGTPLSDAAFGGDRTVAELASELVAASGVAKDRLVVGDAALARLSAAQASQPRPPEEKMVSGPSPEPAEPRIAVRSPSRHRPPEAVWRFWLPVRLARFFLREAVMYPLTSLFVDLRVNGLHHLDPLQPPFLLAANHVSMMDPAALLFALPGHLRGRVAPATMWEYFVARRSGRLQYGLGVLSFNLFALTQSGDWRPSLRVAGMLADAGFCPLIYPEGQRSDNGRPDRFHLGAVVMSAELHLPILPFAAAGLHSVLPRGRRWPRRGGVRRPVVAVQFGEPLPAARPADSREKLLRTLARRIAKLHQAATSISGEL